MNEEKPLISVVLPAYNGSRHLRAAIESCLGQTYDRLELILVDDGSTDAETIAIVDGQGDARVRVVRLEENRGLPRALNAGFAEAKGDLLTWTSDDNLYRPRALEAMAERLRTTGADFVHAGCGVIDDAGETTGKLQTHPARFLSLGNCVGACFLYTRRVYETVGDFDPEMSLAEDYDYWVRVSKSFAMEYLEEDLYLYRYHGAALTAVHGSERVQEQVDCVRRRLFSRAEILGAEGLSAFDRGEKREARRLLAKALVRRPRQLGLWRPLAVVLLPGALVRLAVRLKKVLRPGRQ